MHKDHGVITQFLSVFSQPCSGVFYDRHQIESDQEMSGAPARSVTQTVDFLLQGVGSLASASQVHEFLIPGRTPGYWRIKPWVIPGFDIYHRPHPGVWLTQNTVGTFVYMGQPDAFSISQAGTFYRTGIVYAMPGFMEAVTSHELSSRTDRDAILIDSICIASGRGICARPGIQSDDRSDVTLHDIFIDTNGIMTTVIDSVLNLPVQPMLSDGFLQPVQTLERVSEVSLRSP